MYFIARYNLAAYDCVVGPFETLEAAQAAQTAMKLVSFNHVIVRFPRLQEQKAA